MAKRLQFFVKKTAADKQADAVAGALTISALTRRIKHLLEGDIGRVTITGEIGTLTRAHSGHVYLSLKDEHALIDAVMWRSAAAKLKWEPSEGQAVIARGEISVYEPRGRYQLVVTSLQPVGKGELQIRFEALVKKLRDEGLFEPSRKQPLPTFPRTIGLVTSPTGAALQDIVKVLRRRMPGVTLILAPCRVQGDEAAKEIAGAIEKLDAWGECEVMIVGRGGGALEDLWAFNEEPVARAIAAAQTPIVSAVGHAIDTSIADMVADARAATPSEAAELIVPDRAVLRSRTRTITRNLTAALCRDLQEHRQAVARVADESSSLLRRRVREGRIQLEFARRRLVQAPALRLQEARARLNSLRRSPAIRRPLAPVQRCRQQLDEAQGDIHQAMQAVFAQYRAHVTASTARLEGISPQAIFARGYSLTRNATSGQVMKTTAAVEVGDTLTTRLAEGVIYSRVTTIEPDTTGG